MPDEPGLRPEAEQAEDIGPPSVQHIRRNDLTELTEVDSKELENGQDSAQRAARNADLYSTVPEHQSRQENSRESRTQTYQAGGVSGGGDTKQRLVQSSSEAASLVANRQQTLSHQG